jgi:hypothetical protein
MTPRTYAVLARVSPGYPPLLGRLPTCYSPVRRSTHRPKSTFSHDLHVLSTPPAFILSQDQTLQLKILTAIDRLMRRQRLSILFNRLFRDVRKDSLITGVTVLLDSFYQ